MPSFVSTAVRIALTAIKGNRVRAALTVLGVLIGVASIVIVTALASGAQATVAGQVADFGSNVLFITPHATQQSGAHGKAAGRLTEADGRAIAREASNVSGVGFWLGAQGHVVRGDRNAATSLEGVNLDFLAIRKWTFASGQAWQASDEVVKARVCLLGSKVRDKLFSPGEDPVGQTIRIGAFPFRVAGVLQARGKSPYGEEQDDRVLMPIGSLRARFLHGSPGRVDKLYAGTSSTVKSHRAERDIAALLHQRHRILDGAEDDFKIESESAYADTVTEVLQTMSILFLGVAGISLLVGGVGVMNIMLVSVTERTREIGIRMSIGARGRDVLLQFLVEAIVLTVIGGLAGTVLGIGFTLALGCAIDRPLHPDLSSILVAVGTSGGVGLLFGYLPARRAAALDPIEALRAD